VWRLTPGSLSFLVRCILWLATIPDLTLRPSAARRHSRSSTESPTGRARRDEIPRARLHARPVSLFPTRTHPLLCILYEVISRSSSRTLLASDTTAPPSSGAPRCTLKICPRRHDVRRLAVGRAPDCTTHARAMFLCRGLGLFHSAPS
jgi:hypothetical protein